MIHIDRLRLRLPRHLQPSAEQIARHIARSLAASPPHRNGRIPHVAMPVISVPPDLGPTAIAEHTASRIRSQLARRRP